MIRPALHTDIPKIKALLDPFVQNKIVLAKSEFEIERDLGLTLVSTEENTNSSINGTVSLVFFHDSLCEIRALVVHPQTHGKGLGRSLVLEAEKLALSKSKKKQIRFFALTYTPDFFEKCGYQITTKENFPEKVYEVCQYCLKKDDCHEIAVEKMRNQTDN